MFKKMVSILCAVFLFVASTTPFAVAVEIMASRSIHSTNISIDASGSKVTATATVRTTSKASTLGFSKITLYQYVNDQWEVAAVTTSSYGANNTIYTDSVSCGKVSGRQYKATCSSYALVNGSSDTGSASKGPITAQ